MGRTAGFGVEGFPCIFYADFNLYIFTGYSVPVSGRELVCQFGSAAGVIGVILVGSNSFVSRVVLWLDAQAWWVERLWSTILYDTSRSLALDGFVGSNGFGKKALYYPLSVSGMARFSCFEWHCFRTTLSRL